MKVTTLEAISDRITDKVGLKSVLVESIKDNLKKLESEKAKGWLDYLGLTSTSEKIRDWMIDKALDNLFYHRQYQF